jgi:hypothetical protein
MAGSSLTNTVTRMGRGCETSVQLLIKEVVAEPHEDYESAYGCSGSEER